ncbi:MAG: hypothetical protein M4579_003668 [Chaenotheca gracillima]|nr:MAG: hypothetical protein M4579_003668 [Chaenotheca gracillima]
MSTPNPPSGSASRSSTPNPLTSSRFTAQSSTAEDLLKTQTVGLVHLSEFRKRRAEALEQKEREAQDRSLGRVTPSTRSGTATPIGDGAAGSSTSKKKRKVAKGKLSFGWDDGEEEQEESLANVDESSKAAEPPSTDRSRSSTPNVKKKKKVPPLPEENDSAEPSINRRLGPNAALSNAPKAMTKSALLRDAQTREQLRKEFLAIQEVVKATEINIPFVFYDGTNIPGGTCKVKKGDHVWLFLDKARKLGATHGVGGAGERASSRREWARVGVDDLLLVRGELIIPHHYDFYYFLVNKTLDTNGTPLFEYSNQPTTTTPASPSRSPARDIIQYARSRSTSKDPTQELSDDRLEGSDHDPNITKVVDRRWYERNKHIFPASVWQEFEPDKNYSSAVKRDPGGNVFFFS